MKGYQPESYKMGLQVSCGAYPKQRKKAIFGAVRRRLGEVFRELARHKQAEVVEGHLMPDHMHIWLSIPLKIAVANVVGHMKAKARSRYRGSS